MSICLSIGPSHYGINEATDKKASNRCLVASASILLHALPLPLPLAHFKHPFRFRTSDTSFLSILNTVNLQSKGFQRTASIFPIDNPLKPI